MPGLGMHNLTPLLPSQSAMVVHQPVIFKQRQFDQEKLKACQVRCRLRALFAGSNGMCQAILTGTVDSRPRGLRLGRQTQRMTNTKCSRCIMKPSPQVQRPPFTSKQSQHVASGSSLLVRGCASGQFTRKCPRNWYQVRNTEIVQKDVPMH